MRFEPGHGCPSDALVTAVKDRQADFVAVPSEKEVTTQVGIAALVTRARLGEPSALLGSSERDKPSHELGQALPARNAAPCRRSRNAG